MKAILIKIISLAFVLLILLIVPKQLFSNNFEKVNGKEMSTNTTFNIKDADSVSKLTELPAYDPPCPAGEVEVIFTLDMTCSDTDLRPPVITGPFNGFSGDGNVMVDPDGDDIWEAVICAVPGSTFEYKYAILNFVEQENLVDDAIGGAPCTYNTNFFDFSNRLVTIPAGGGALPVDTYGICGTCENPPVNVTFSVNMNCSDVPPGTQVAMFGGFNGFCCPYNLEDPDGDNIWTTTLPFPPDENGCITMDYLYMSPNFSNVESFLTNGEDLSTCPNINTDFYNFANRIITLCADTVLDDYWNTCFAPEEPAGGCDDSDCDNGVEAWDGCECITSAAIAGCTDDTACNYDPNANCNDGTCDFGNAACPDPCNEPDPDDGCDLTVDNFDASTCTVTNIALCGFGTEFNEATCTCDDVLFFGCTDPCADNYDPNADTDDGSCNPYDMTCNTDCTLGPFGGIWDAVTCSCINEIMPINGCTDSTACNFDMNANCEDNSCNYGNTACADPCNPIAGCMDDTACNYNPDACLDDGSCEAAPCNPGCTDPCAVNYDPNADADDGSCELPVEPPTQCYEIAVFNTVTCEWEVIGDQPAAPTDLECYETTTFNNTTCLWEIAGDQPEEPSTGCGEFTVFNNSICDWEIIQEPPPPPPLIECFETATYDVVTCTWIVTGFPPPPPPLACYETFMFDDIACVFIISGEQPPIDDNCDITVDTFDDVTCMAINTPNCTAGTTYNASTCNCDTDIIFGCTDPCADNFDSNANEDDGSCNPYDMTCNTDCLLGDIEIWDAASCSCIIDIPTISGCTDSGASNYDPNANCEDGTCEFILCEDPCAPNFGAQEACESYDTTCNDDCTVGSFGGIWDATTCSCINETTPINGCTDAMATNYDPAANCDDGSCFTTCEDEISGTINTDMTCDVSGIAVLITDAVGNPVGMAIADANGNYALSGLYPCGEYIATLDASSIPVCYTDTGGDVGPSGFIVNGDGQADGANFSSFDEVPTLSQWGLMILALLLMTFGALKLIHISTFEKSLKANKYGL